MRFGIDEDLESIAFGEARHETCAVLDHAPLEIAGHADIDRTLRPVCHDVDPAALRAHRCLTSPFSRLAALAPVMMAGSSPAMTGMGMRMGGAPTGATPLAWSGPWCGSR